MIVRRFTIKPRFLSHSFFSRAIVIEESLSVSFSFRKDAPDEMFIDDVTKFNVVKSKREQTEPTIVVNRHRIFSCSLTFLPTFNFFALYFIGCIN